MITFPNLLFFLVFSFQHRKYFSSGRLTERGETLSLSSVSRRDEGVYVCVADNNVGDMPVRREIDLNVLCE